MIACVIWFAYYSIPRPIPSLSRVEGIRKDKSVSYMRTRMICRDAVGVAAHYNFGMEVTGRQRRKESEKEN